MSDSLSTSPTQDNIERDCYGNPLNWKIEAHEMDRWNYLAGKFDNISDIISNKQQPLDSDLFNLDEIVEFLTLWYRRKPSIEFAKCVLGYFNRGDNDILYK
ncbi:putative orfan [Tupanvirus soda lake]|uniref:Orfan n=2 Tax=Tupanvirus TaxID=2094720 RepID=A0AC62ACB3_9VIRU|nr:putative orfan [Tupanvirus soda lake]QKU35337.1 putative orfan [Tupanvirus soda lake]